MKNVPIGAANQDQNEFEIYGGNRSRMAPTTPYPAVIGHRTTVGIAPEELLVLPASLRADPLADPRRRDLFSALRRRQDAVSSRDERRRRRVSTTRRSDDVLAGMLTRTGRDARTSLFDQRNGRGSSCNLTLLRAGCPRPEIQKLYRPEEVGLGQAMRLAGGDSSSDLDSGISEWGSDDGDDVVAFEELLEEETRAVRGIDTASTSWSKSSHRSPICPVRSSPRAESRHRPVHNSISSEETEVGPSASPQARPGGIGVSEAMTEKPTVEALSSTPEETSSACQRTTSSLSQAQPSPSARDPKTRSEGVQCSGPPVDQGVQTTAILRLPRRAIDTKCRTFEPKFPPKTVVDQHHWATRVETATRDFTVESRQRRPHDKTLVEGAGAQESQVHVRVGLECVQDADRGQQPTVWAVTRGEDSSATGPVIMLSLEGNDVKRGARKYLSVTDFTSDEKNGEDRGDSDERRHNEKKERPTVEDSHNWEDGEEGEEDEELCRTTCSRLEPLWDGLGSLGERLAGVNARFDQLDQEISHDRKVIENYQREAREEADMATKDLVDIWAQRAARPAANPSLKAPLRRNRKDCTDDLRIEIPPFSACGRGSHEIGDGEEGFTVEHAAVQAEEELREARAILKSIEEKLRPDTADGKSSCPSATAASAGPLVVETNLGSEPTVLRAGSPKTKPQPAPSTTRSGLPAGQGKRTSFTHSQRLGSHPIPAYSCGGSRQASSKFSGNHRAMEPGRVAGRTGSARGGVVGTRSVGTAIAHFPTASAARSTRGRKVTRRAWA